MMVFQKYTSYKEGDNLTDNEVSYRPKAKVDTELSRLTSGHGGGDFYTMHYFLEKLLGRSAGEECIDIYQALDMGLPGILAYRSICNGNMPVEVPDFRNIELREKYRNDNWCTATETAGDNLAPFNSFGDIDIPDSVYESVRKTWEEKRSSK